MKNIDLLFNFIGVTVVDWPAAFQFFHQTLGMNAKLEPRYGDWATLGYHNDSGSASFELFDRGRAVTERQWGVNQGFRPGLHVSNLQETIQKINTKKDISIGEIVDCPWGRIAEFITTEGIRFAFTEIPNTPFSDDLSMPYIGHVAIKCADFAAMQNFYRDVFGFSPMDVTPDYAVFTQADGYPWVILEAGGSASHFDVRNTQWEKNAVRAFPVFISLMTTDIQNAYTYLNTKNTVVLRELISVHDWGGADLHIADPDGNAIQIVQYT